MPIFDTIIGAAQLVVLTIMTTVAIRIAAVGIGRRRGK